MPGMHPSSCILPATILVLQSLCGESGRGHRLPLAYVARLWWVQPLEGFLSRDL